MIAPYRRNEVGENIRTSNSESVIYERRIKTANLDPRVYPSWWGEDDAEDKKVIKNPPIESSLERGIREIR